MAAKKDFTQVAFDVVQIATGEMTEPTPTKKQQRSRKGGLKGGAARASSLTPEQRAEIARLAAQARWKKA